MMIEIEEKEKEERREEEGGVKEEYEEMEEKLKKVFEEESSEISEGEESGNKESKWKNGMILVDISNERGKHFLKILQNRNSLFPFHILQSKSLKDISTFMKHVIDLFDQNSFFLSNSLKIFLAGNDSFFSSFLSPFCNLLSKKAIKGLFHSITLFYFIFIFFYFVLFYFLILFYFFLFYFLILFSYFILFFILFFFIFILFSYFILFFIFIFLTENHLKCFE